MRDALRVTRCEVRGTGCGVRVTRCADQVAGFRFGLIFVVEMKYQIRLQPTWLVV